MNVSCVSSLEMHDVGILSNLVDYGEPYLWSWVLMGLSM